MTFEQTLKQYDYVLPPELIAQDPAKPRDSARLLVYERNAGNVSYGHLRDIVQFLSQNAVAVFNETKVLPAPRVFLSAKRIS